MRIPWLEDQPTRLIFAQETYKHAHVVNLRLG